MKIPLILVWGLLFQEPVEKTAQTDDALLQLNLEFRADYARSRAKILSDAGPVIVAGGVTMTLYHAGKSSREPIFDDRYARLKALSHIPLHLFVLLRGENAGPLDQAKKTRLVELRKRWEPLPGTLEGLQMSRETVQRNQRLLRATLLVSRGWVEGEDFDPAKLREYCREQWSTIDANAVEAARAQFETMDRTINRWKKELGADWDKVRVIVRGMQMPRKDNLSVSYFAKLLGEKGECERIVYGEGLVEDETAKALLGTRILDTEVGEVFFADRWRMHRDLLGEAAREVLEKDGFPRVPPTGK